MGADRAGRGRQAAPAHAVVRVQRLLAIAALVVASLIAVGYAATSVVNARRHPAEQGDHLRARAELARLGLSRTCGRITGCVCPAVTSEVFDTCRMVEGHVALSIPSADACFAEWMVVDTVWAKPPSPMYFGPYWVSRYPRSIAPGWSLIAVAPCLD